MIAVFGVSRSGCYVWTKYCQNPSVQQLPQQAVDAKIKSAFYSSKQRDGARRIQVELHEQGHLHDIKMIGRSMKRQNLVAKAARKFKVTTDSNHRLPVAPNLLGQNFTVGQPNQKWAGDITYLYTREGWLYLAVMIDLHSRAVIGWSMSTRMTADLVCDSLSMALGRREFPKGMIVRPRWSVLLKGLPVNYRQAST